MSLEDVNEQNARRAARTGGGGLVTGDSESAVLESESVEVNALYVELGDAGSAGNTTRVIVDDAAETVTIEAANGLFINGVEITG